MGAYNVKAFDWDAIRMRPSAGQAIHYGPAPTASHYWVTHGREEAGQDIELGYTADHVAELLFPQACQMRATKKKASRRQASYRRVTIEPLGTRGHFLALSRLMRRPSR